MAKSPMVTDEPGFEAPTAPTPKLPPPQLPKGQLRGWRVVHPSFGSQMFWADEHVKDEAGAIEAYHTMFCPTFKLALLQDSGLAVFPKYFTPAETEIGKPPNPVRK